MQKDNIIDEINILIKDGENLLLKGDADRKVVSYPDFNNWITKIKMLVSQILPDENQFRCKIDMYKYNDFLSTKTLIDILNSILAYEAKGIIEFRNPTIENKRYDIESLFKNFHRIVKQLRIRYNDRPTLDVIDEYDVQDLLHSLLILYYDDIRTEEWTPSYAGKTSRQDFLLKREKIVIETKMTREKLTDKELGTELIEDIERYGKHPDCKQLYFFIYDPLGRVRNPKGFITDIEESHKGFVRVFINPEM